MHDEIIKTIYPDNCEVIEIAAGTKYVYPIFKCGRSSLYESISDNNWKTISNHDIAKISTPITVFVRDPRERFISGVNTYVQHLQSNKNLDVNTVLYFVEHYLFLNRHFAPQFSWLLNLARFGGCDQVLLFRPLHMISDLTSLHSNAGVEPITAELQSRIAEFDWDKLELYMFLDQIIVDHVDRPVTFRQLVSYIYKNHRELYDLVFKRSYELAQLIHAVP